LSSVPSTIRPHPARTGCRKKRRAFFEISEISKVLGGVSGRFDDAGFYRDERPDVYASEAPSLPLISL